MEVIIREMLNRCLDKLARPQLSLLDRKCSSYKVCGYTGLGCAAVLGLCLAWLMSLLPWVVLCLLPVSALTFFGLAMGTKILTGQELITYYHHQIAVMTSTSLVLRLLDAPVLPYLDITALGLGMFLACGRIGCFMVGCCHGKPHGWGVCYTEKHREAGFTSHLVGVRLFPVQAVESLFVLLVVVVGTALVLSSTYRPGEALTWYIIAYGAARFFLEFLRGDPERPYFVGFSEAQWTSLLLMGALLATESLGFVPFHLWHWFVVGTIGLTMILLGWRRAAVTGRSLQALTPAQVRELVETLDSLATRRRVVDQPRADLFSYGVPTRETSFGLRISAGQIETPEGEVFHYALSGAMVSGKRKAAERLAAVILRLRHPSASFRLLDGGRGIYYILAHPGRE